MLDVHRLRVLRAVAREGSFSAAARALDYTQPAISHHIARLEADAEEEVAAIAGLRAGRVRLAAFPSASATLVPAAFSALQAEHRGITVSLVEEEPPEALALLRAGDVDVAVAFGYPQAELVDGPDLAVEPLLEDRLLAVLPAGHARSRAASAAAGTCCSSPARPASSRGSRSPPTTT